MKIICYNEGTTREWAEGSSPKKERKRTLPQDDFPFRIRWPSESRMICRSVPRKRNWYETRKQRRRGRRKNQTENSLESLSRKTKPHSTYRQPFRVRKQKGKRKPRKLHSLRGFSIANKKVSYPDRKLIWNLKFWRWKAEKRDPGNEKGNRSET